MKHQENDVKETKKIRKKRSARTVQQIKLAVIMIMVSVLVLSASTFAWYQLSNTTKITNMQFTADTMGNLKIAPEENGSEGTYGNELNLALDTTPKKLLPATTKDGQTFFSPLYHSTGDTVTGFTELKTDNTNGFDKYVYKKVFYLKSGDSKTGNTFTLKLDRGSKTPSNTGTYIVDKQNNNPNTIDGLTAANALRISFVFEDTDDSNKTPTVTKIFEPNSDLTTPIQGTSASYSGNDYGPEVYNTITIKQKNDGTFDTGVNTALFTLKEGIPVKVTMYVWIEGQDTDCKTEIALDTIEGQIQFIAE